MNPDQYIDFYYANITFEQRFTLRMILNSWGKQCFNAAREIEYTTTGDVDDIPGVVVSYKYDDFEDYLKQLDNESNSTD